MRRRGFLTLSLIFAALPLTATAADKKRGTETFISLPTLTASMIRADGGRGVLSVEAGLDVPDPALNARAQGLQPRLLDAYARILGVYGRSIPPAGAPNPDVLGLQLQRATDRVLGRPGARLLFGSIIVN